MTDLILPVLPRRLHKIVFSPKCKEGAKIISKIKLKFFEAFIVQSVLRAWMFVVR